MKEQLLKKITSIRSDLAAMELLIADLPGDIVIPIPDPEPELPACKKNPTITSISNITDVGATLNFDALGVDELRYWISKEKEGESIYKGILYPKSSLVDFAYPKQSPGSLYINIEGNNCKSPVSSRKFTIKDEEIVVPPPVINPPSHRGKLFIMNMTGHGFDIHDKTGLRDTMREQVDAWVNLEWDGNKFSGIDVARPNVKWFEYEPTEGVYRDDLLVAAQQWLKQRGLMISTCLVPWRQKGDGMFSDYDKARLSNGEIWTNNPVLNDDVYIPSMNSEAFREKFKKTAAHMASVLMRDPDYAYSMYMATAQSEEYQMIRQENPTLITGYGDVDRDKWKAYSGGRPMPPYMENQDQYNEYMSTADGRMWYEFQTKALADTHAAFVAGVRQGGMMAGGMYAGAGAATAVCNFTFKLNDIFSAGKADQPDIIYSSEGDSGSRWSKLMATDLNIATFPGARLAIEFDHDDVAWTDQRDPPRDTPINPGLLLEYILGFWERGGMDIHWAMDFLPEIIKQFSGTLWKARHTELASDLPQGEKITYAVSRYYGDQDYRSEWGRRGGGFKKQVKIILK